MPASLLVFVDSFWISFLQLLGSNFGMILTEQGEDYPSNKIDEADGKCCPQW